MAAERSAAAFGQGRERIVDDRATSGKLIYRLGFPPNGRYGYRKGNMAVVCCGRRIRARPDAEGFLYRIPCAKGSDDGKVLSGAIRYSV